MRSAKTPFARAILRKGGGKREIQCNAGDPIAQIFFKPFPHARGSGFFADECRFFCFGHYVLPKPQDLRGNMNPARMRINSNRALLKSGAPGFCRFRMLCISFSGLTISVPVSVVCFVRTTGDIGLYRKRGRAGAHIELSQHAFGFLCLSLLQRRHNVESALQNFSRRFRAYPLLRNIRLQVPQRPFRNSALCCKRAFGRLPQERACRRAPSLTAFCPCAKRFSQTFRKAPSLCPSLRS